jgi:outer membrane protein
MNRLLPKLLLLTALLSAMPIWGQTPGNEGAAIPAAKIGYVDFGRLVESAPQIAVARDQLDAEFRPRNEAIDANEQSLRELEERFQRDAAIMASSEVQSMERRIRALRRDVQRDRQDLADELDFRLNEETQRVEEEIYEIVRNFARENGYDLILPGPALYASDTINLTDELLARLRTEADQPIPVDQP